MASSLGDLSAPGPNLDTSPSPAFTVGYEGRTISEFVLLLQANGVEQVVDIREIPLSRKKGFSKTSLERNLLAAGIRYVLIKALGSPSKIRAQYRETGDFAHFKRRYERHLSSSAIALSELEAHLAERPSAILCFERDPAACHRSIVCHAIDQTSFFFTHI